MPHSDRPQRRRRLVACAFAALAVLALPAVLYARAGGGDSYSGSGSGSGGRGGGGDVDGWFELLYYLLRFCYYYPKVGVPLLVVVIAIGLYVWRKGKEGYITSVIRRAARDRAKADRYETMLRTNDPAFTAAAFVQRVSGAFHKIQEAWSRQDLSAVRPFLSDAVHERFGLQFDEQRFLGYRNQTTVARVESITLASANSDAHFDHLDVRIVAWATDQNVRLSDGKAISGSGAARPFAEVWSFLRRRGATTRSGASGLMEGNCPNCGAAIAMNQNANCQHCGALLRSGQYDWVLVEITQEFEWQPGGAGDAPGVRALAKRDPGFDVQELEDRASVVFWRKVTADRLASVQPLRKCALPAFCEQYERELRERRDGGNGAERTYFGQCAVGSVDVRGVRLANAQDNTDVTSAAEYDRALIEVRWSGTRFTVSPGGKPQRHEQSAVSRMLLVLARQPDVRSNVDKSISSAHCPTCGAPESGGTSGACDFCGATLNDGSITWALEAAMDLADPRAGELMEGLDVRPGDRPAASTPGAPAGVAAEIPSSAGMLAWMVKASLADGELDARERALLESVAARHRVPVERLDQMIAAARSGTLDVPAPAGQEDARENLRAIAYAALADGRLAPAENALLRQVARRAGVSDYDVSQLLRRARKELYADARQHLRAARNGAANGDGNGHL